jgi:protein phosphatase
MGGLSNGQQASSAAVRAFLTAYERKPSAETIPAAMHRSLQATFDVVQELNRSVSGQSGATLVAAVAHGNELYWVSVGDSRLYLLRQGRLVQLSRDHNYREKLFEQVAGDRLELAEAISHPEREHLTSFLGMTGAPEVDGNVRPFLLEPDDLVILCTDGVYRALSEADFASAFAGGNPSTGCEAVKAMVLARASQQQDNLTVAALRCVGESWSRAAGFGKLRSRLPLAGACLLLGVNLYAATFTYHQLRSQMAILQAGKSKAKPKEPGVSPGVPDAGPDPHSGSRHGEGKKSGGGKEAARKPAPDPPEPPAEDPPDDPKPREPEGQPLEEAPRAGTPGEPDSVKPESGETRKSGPRKPPKSPGRKGPKG